MLELKRISRDYKIPVIAISSFNRDNYSAPVNTAAFKESGAVEYSADVLIGLQYHGMERQEKGNGKAENDNDPERLGPSCPVDEGQRHESKGREGRDD